MGSREAHTAPTISFEMASRWTKAAAAVMAALVLVPASVMAQGGNDLGKVLEGQANLTTFLGLYKVSTPFRRDTQP